MSVLARPSRMHSLTDILLSLSQIQRTTQALIIAYRPRSTRLKTILVG
jgi:hypothetical protein